MYRSLEENHPLKEEVLLYEAIRNGDAAAVIGGDVAHGQEDANWYRREGKVVGVTERELAATMNTELIVWEAVAENPKRVVWTAGNHDLQEEDVPLSTGDKSAAIAIKMQRHPRLGTRFQAEWAKRERLLPLAAVSPDLSVIFSHAAPGPNLALADIEQKSMGAFLRLAGTENIHGMPGAMSEDGMMINMKFVVDQINGSGNYDFVLNPDWTWMIGHRPTDDEPNYLRVQCGGRLRQINTSRSQAYAVYTPERELFIGDCRYPHEPLKKVEIQVD